MKTILTTLLLFLSAELLAQITISGKIFTENEKEISGANVFLQGTYDGCTSDSLGNFSFSSDAKNKQLLIVSFVGFETFGLELEIGDSDLFLNKIILKEKASEINEVVINAGTFEASDKKKSVMLKPIDIALTAGANGDIFGAFGTLPGSQFVGEEGRLFVRGGESYETKTFMDGMLVNSPFYSKMPDLPTRGRFSPLLFNGAVFSTGGYSAEFGQALSSVVALNTIALEPEDKATISIMTVGFQGSKAKRWKNNSLTINGELIHSGLSNQIFKPKIEWLKNPFITGTTLLFRQKTSETGMIKAFGSLNYDSSNLLHQHNAFSEKQEIALSDFNSYFNTTFNEMLAEKWMINGGIAANLDNETIQLPAQKIKTQRKNTQLKLNFSHSTAKNIHTKMGAEFLNYNYRQNIEMHENYLLDFSNNQLSAFIETEIKITSAFAFRAGLRAEYSSLLKKAETMPRLSAAVKTSKKSQLSMAFGTFRQNPGDDYLKFQDALIPEKAAHSILTYQFKNDTKTLRIEAYYKKYADLVKFIDEYSFEAGNYSNAGSGYSRGFDVFWRNQKPFGKSDYWISYSWNDSKRNYRNFPGEVTPTYVSAHNLSLVYKKFFPKLNSFVSGTYSFASGRPYFNPNNSDFLSDFTQCYNDVSIGFTHILYLFNKQTVLHAIVNNILGFENIFGYNYSETPNSNGVFEASPITPPNKRMAVLLISFQL